MYTIVLFTVTVVVLGKTVSSQVEPPVGTFGACTSFAGTKGDSSDCSIYYRCTNGEWVRNQCLSGFHFNKLSQSCDFINHAACKVGDPEQGTEPPTFGSCTSFAGTKGDSSDCSIYYRCTSGKWVRNQCLSGFNFNKVSQSCDFINNAGCTVGDPEQGKEPPAFGTCTSFGGTKGDSSDCTIYYRCATGQWVRNKCLSGFHFNKISQSCDFINHAGCTVGDPEQGKEPPTFGACSGFGTTTGDIKSCSIYYQCLSGQWKRTQCLSGFYYNDVSRRCDFISNVRCTKAP